MNLNYSAVDLRYDESGATVLEANPGGRFAMAEAVGIPISESIAKWLAHITE